MGLAGQALPPRGFGGQVDAVGCEVEADVSGGREGELRSQRSGDAAPAETGVRESAPFVAPGGGAGSPRRG